MTQYLQETDSRIVYPLASPKHMPVAERRVSETLGAGLYTHYLPISRDPGLFRGAWELAYKLRESVVASEARKLLTILQETVITFQQFRLDLSYIPPLQAIATEDGSILFEWIFRDYRVGFNIEPNSADSSWYLVTNRHLGEISAAGYLAGVDLNSLVLWLLNFIISHA